MNENTLNINKLNVSRESLHLERSFQISVFSVTCAFTSGTVGLIKKKKKKTQVWLT